MFTYLMESYVCMSEKKFVVVVDGEGSRREMKGNGARMLPYHV